MALPPFISHETDKPRPWWAKAALITFPWFVAGVLYGMQSYIYRVSAGRDATLVDVMPLGMYNFLIWAPLTPLIVRLARRFPLDRHTWRTNVLIHAGFAVAFATFHRVLFDVVWISVKATPEQPFTWAQLVHMNIGYIDTSLLIYSVVLLVIYAFDYSNRYRQEQIAASRLKAELATSQLQALTMQLQPHFLFNTLNAISVLIKEDPAAAQRMLEVLSDLLRRTVASGMTQEVTVREEIELLRLYLQIEQTRFGDRLSVRMSIDPETREAVVPNLLLQPLVENAMRHGVARRRGEGIVEITTRRENGVLQLAVRDNGYGFSADAGSAADGKKNGKGIGLANTRARLETLYGARGTLTLANAPEGGAVATITLPFRSSTEVRP